MITFSNSNHRAALLFAFLLLDGLFLLAYAPTLSLSEGEARLFFGDTGWLGELVRFSAQMAGQDNFGVRLPFVALHLVNLVLIYLVSADIVKKPQDAFLAVLIFALLPGVNSAAVLISSAGPAITFLLLFVLALNRFPGAAAGLLLFLSALDGVFLLLAMAMAFYALHKRDWVLLGAAVVAFGLCFGLYGFDSGGRPKGYFLDIFGLYGAIFSPLMFIFFIYTLYWYPYRSGRPLPLLWFVALVPFVLSIVLSLRQNLPMEDFGPYAVIATPMMAAAFMSSWRIRLPGYRRVHGWLFGVVFVSLIALLLLSVFHKPLYALFDNPRRHFAYEHHFVDELGARLLALNISAVKADSAGLQARLRFYGVAEGGPFALTRAKPGQNALPLEFEAAGRVVAVYYLWVPEAAK